MGLAKGDDGKPDRRPLNNAIRDLVELIWEEGGFRFWHRRTSTSNGSTFSYYYYCSQNGEKSRKSKGEGMRLVPTMNRFKCDGELLLKPHLNGRILRLKMVHSYHTPYVNIELNPAIQNFIDARIADSTPSTIARDLAASGLQGTERVAQHQVYYRWQQKNASYWRRDADQFLSATTLLTESSASTICDHEVLNSGNLHALALFVRESMTALRFVTKELAMDVTYGTNHAGMELFAVLAEVDGVGIPLAYCFVGVTPSANGTNRAESGALTKILAQFLRRIQQAGFSPTFFGTDKDMSELNAVKLVWPEAKHQLCYWHALRAIRTKLKDSSKSKLLAKYDPAEAGKLVPGLEMCWGSVPIRRPDGPHRYERCECPSSRTRFEEIGRTEGLSAEEKETVIQMFSRHFNYHSLIPDGNGIFRPAQDIHRQCASEMYHYCKARDFFRLWAYFFINWYSHEQWKLWARSANAMEIPVLKTTMIVESHWRVLKHQFLHRFNRPRIDLVTSILVTRVMPDALVRMRAVKSGENRVKKTAWRKGFQRNWAKLQGCLVEPGSIARYHTNPHKWVCACESFLLGRFFICKHLHCISPIPTPSLLDFFRRVRRRRTWPFLQHNQLVALPEFKQYEDESPNIGLHENSSDTESEVSDVDPDGIVDEDSFSNDGSSDYADQDSSDENTINPRDFLVQMASAIDIAREQDQKGNKAFVDKFMASYSTIPTLVKEINRKKARKSMSQTWEKYLHPATMYYN